jgi:glycine/D-amino acid oxidase-like deaminating enzyme
MSFKASRGNAGLVWVQGKGQTMPTYAKVTHSSSLMWADYAKTLQDRTGLNLELSQRGGVDICTTAEEAQELQAEYQAFYGANPDLQKLLQWEYLDNQSLQEHLPGLGKTIHGGMWSPHDGHCNPLNLLTALYKACHDLGVEFQLDAQVESVTPLAQGFSVKTKHAEFNAERVVLAAGLGTLKLAPSLGLSNQVKPIRGQVLITEKCPPKNLLPSPQIRQTGNGSYLIGFTYEDVGYEHTTELDTVSQLGARACAIFPELEQVKLVRTWSALRIMTPDGCPVYETSKQYPGAYSLICPRGFTLSAFHAHQLAQAINDDTVHETLAEFSGERFSV